MALCHINLDLVSNGGGETTNICKNLRQGKLGQTFAHLTNSSFKKLGGLLPPVSLLVELSNLPGRK